MLDSVTEDRVHNSVNELTQRTIGQNPAISLSYGDAGNLTQDGGSDENHQYVWDCRNRLIEAKERQSGDWNTVGTYRYDAQGRRGMGSRVQVSRVQGKPRSPCRGRLGGRAALPHERHR